ncbi:F-box/WD repeat-containing protein 5-like [Polyodon spathula]|uniref:F-box/WD repeat-containing protein 5-like n=1 Tax=Polyodon spathula TaxID=7913 RepID=UPI001B7DAC5A|nr:F-box/WD repeat-containing protein 5-like [Polyodon spathula]
MVTAADQPGKTERRSEGCVLGHNETRTSQRYYCIPRAVPRHPAAVSWLREFQRLFDSIPCVEVCALKEHHDQVLHLSFSHTGYLFASCSKDCTVKIWNNDLDISLLHSSNMREFNWGYTQFSQFNSDDTLLLVSGVYVGRHHSSSGEIAVISLDDFTLLSRVRNKPYDVFGCWLNESHLISGNLHWIGNITSCSVLWLNKAFQVRGEESQPALTARAQQRPACNPVSVYH